MLPTHRDSPYLFLFFLAAFHWSYIFSLISMILSWQNTAICSQPLFTRTQTFGYGTSSATMIACSLDRMCQSGILSRRKSELRDVDCCEKSDVPLHPTPVCSKRHKSRKRRTESCWMRRGRKLQTNSSKFPQRVPSLLCLYTSGSAHWLILPHWRQPSAWNSSWEWVLVPGDWVTHPQGHRLKANITSPRTLPK